MPKLTYQEWRNGLENAPDPKLAYDEAPEEWRRLFDRETLAAMASEAFDKTTPTLKIIEAYAAFHQLVFDLPLSKHMIRVITKVINSWKTGKGTVVELFRGAAKTTDVTIGWTTFLIGHNPDKSFLLVQVGDDIARDNSNQIADIIKNNAGFSLVFPNIKPDEVKGWGSGGYDVKRSDMPYEEWRRLNAGRKDPTLVAVGYGSSAIIGKRPWYLVLDDINDEKNTASERKLREVKKILKGTIFPAANTAEWLITIGTPWTEADALHYCLNTGIYEHIKIPVYTNEKPTWPEMYDEEAIEKERAKAGEIEFARMFLLDLEKTKGLVLKKEALEPTFRNEDIKTEWPAIIFIDYTSTANPEKELSDYFALAVLQLIPDGRRAVVSDGIYRRVSHFDAQKLAINKIMQYSNLLVVGVESVFTGQEYRNTLAQNQELIDNGIIPKACRGGPWSKRKGERFEHVLSDLFQRNVIVLSDTENELINAFRDEWVSWQGDSLADMGHDDALDAVFGASYLALDYVSYGQNYREQKYRFTNPLYPRETQPSFLEGTRR